MKARCHVWHRFLTAQLASKRLCVTLRMGKDFSRRVYIIIGSQCALTWTNLNLNCVRCGRSCYSNIVISINWCYIINAKVQIILKLHESIINWCKNLNIALFALKYLLFERSRTPTVNRWKFVLTKTWTFIFQII